MHQPEDHQVKEMLDEKIVAGDPFTQFRHWFDDTVKAGIAMPEAMTLATCTREGKPSGRLVLLKQVDERGFVFFTNYKSVKARDLDENPFAALVFYWPQLERQVRVEGKVERTSAAESNEYFQSRPRESQIGALASPQSQRIESREVLEQLFSELNELYRERPVQRPDHWGGYRLVPARIEFWKGRPNRLHDRILYERRADGTWSVARLAP